MDQSKAHRPFSPWQVQSRKHSAEVRVAEPRTPYTFPLILALPGQRQRLWLKSRVDTLLTGPMVFSHMVIL